MDYTKLFTEQVRPLARINPASYNSVQETARVAVKNYHRFVVLMGVGVLGSSATLDLEIDEYKAASGGVAHKITGKEITQLTQAGADANKIVAIELATEEMTADYNYITAKATPAVSTAILWVLVLGFVGRYEPVGDDEFDEVVD